MRFLRAIGYFNSASSKHASEKQQSQHNSHYTQDTLRISIRIVTKFSGMHDNAVVVLLEILL